MPLHREINSETKIPIGISSCLLGEQVRYDGGHKLNHNITDVLSEYFEFISLCPEIAIGLGVPRPTIRLLSPLNAPRASIEFIQKLANKDQPFFLYVGFTHSHYPCVTAPEFEGKSPAGPYGDAIMELDYRTGGKACQILECRPVASRTGATCRDLL